MNAQTQIYTIPGSLRQPNAMLDSLQGILQQALRSSTTLSLRAAAVVRGRGVYLIDNNAERAQYIASLLVSAGYRSIIVASTLDAFTHFLQGTFVPMAVIALQEETNQRFFLNRLSKQILDKYEWEILFVRLLLPPSDQFLPRTTAPLAPLQSSGALPSSTTRPLPPLQSPQTSGKSDKSALYTQTTAPLPRLPAVPASSIEEKNPSRQVQEKVLSKQENKEKLSLEGENLGRYQIYESRGGGPLCAVYRAYDRMRELDVALKVIPTSTITYQINEGSTELPNFFQPELDLLADLKHPHILPIIHIGKSYVSGQPFFYKTTRYCPEGALDSWLLQHDSKMYAPREVLGILFQLADALRVIHEHQKLYRNFKLSNILVLNQAESMPGLNVALVDFAFEHDGVCYARTPANYRYMAPEQFDGQSSPASEQYGLAAIIYELLTKRPPFQGNSEQIMKRMHANMQTQPPSILNPAISPALNKVMLRALAKRPEERYASVVEFAQAFQRYCG
ncbi:MAG TPA: serine/threonine-protein kinase [Ktedonobacteraceae bacterium]|nr:serine/threonine-protein kinase [Ktedonobacteraceae bacterium]